MPEFKRNFTKGRINKDLDERLIPSGEYRDALNIEVATSEGSNVGTVQSLKGNTSLTDLFTINNSNKAVCVGSIANEATNKIYWFITDKHRNFDASWDTNFSLNSAYASTTVAGAALSIVHKVYSDYILEYDETADETNFVVVENVKVKTIVSNPSHAAGDHVHVSNLGTSGDIRPVGIMVGMDVYLSGIPKTTIIKIEEDDAGGFNGWRVYTEHTASDIGYEGLADVVAGDSVKFKQPHEKRALAFNHFAFKNPGKIITGINIIDNLLFFTDGITEPKKINIDRCKYGSTHDDLAASYPNGTRKFPTLLIVNGQIPSFENYRLGKVTDYPSAISFPFLSYQHTTVIRKSPTTALRLTMSSTKKTDLPPIDGSVIVDAYVTLAPTFPNASPVVQSSEFFFDSADVLANGSITEYLVFPQNLDWEIGDVVEFYPQSDQAGFDNTPLAVALVNSKQNGTASNVFDFEIMSISSGMTKVFMDFRVMLQEEESLFEFKFPRFAYRWKYEDGEYSTYSPFSEVAFIPDEFDYLPKKGFNLGMTNNLQYLLLSGFKPTTMPLDVVEIDLLYKESNSPNVYTVETIKSPSTRNTILNTIESKGDLGWFGEIKDNVQSPNTLETSLQIMLNGTFTGQSQVVSGVTYYEINEDITDNKINITTGDVITFTASQTGLTATIKVVDQKYLFSSLGVFGGLPNPETSLFLALSEGTSNTAVTSTAISWLYADSPFNVSRTLPKKPAVYLDDAQGSFEIKSDMIHATLPSNQLLRPWDNVPKSALCQEITGNRIVYGNYVQNYDLKDLENNIKTPVFRVATSNRKNIRENIQYNFNTALVNPNDGTAITASDPLNVVSRHKNLPERSLKSLRNYQVGLVWADEFGRQTPVQTHSSGLKRLNKHRADNYNGLNIKLRDSDTWPEFATHYKYYIKENSNEYYNLAMDRFYDAEDGNVWISFPSSERNKVDEETFLILKKQHDNSVFVEEPARYKILAIENEAPDFVRTKFESAGNIGTTFGEAGEPRYQRQYVDVPDAYFESGEDDGPVGVFYKVLKASERVLRIKDPTNTSFWYDVVNIVAYSDTTRRITIKKAFGYDASFTTVDGTATGAIRSNLSIEMAEKVRKNLPEFGGRFFVKLLKDGVFEKNILALADGKTYVAAQTYNLGAQDNIVDDEDNFRNSSNAASRMRWTVQSKDKNKSSSSQQNHAWEGYPEDTTNNNTSPMARSSDGPTDDLVLNQSTLDFIVYNGSYGNISRGHRFNVTRTNTFGETQENVTVGRRMRTPGQLFKWKGDTTTYRVKTIGAEWMIENFKPSTKNSNRPKKASNHAVGLRMVYEPAMGSTGPDALGAEGTGYNPFDSNVEGTLPGSTFGVDTGDTWPCDFRFKSDHETGVINPGEENSLRQIQFIDEIVSDDSYSSDNPAIWETEPKEDIDLDLYNEASDLLPIDSEWNAYKNEFISKSEYGAKNDINYYNCFSFGNGVESNRIRDDFNAVTIDKGPKVSTVLAEQYREEHRKSGLIYSGIYNSTSGINRLNQFIMAEKITKDLNPTYGSIQKLYSKETNLVTFCEDRVIGVLANKDALFNADGNSNITATSNVLGAATPYAGDFGISTNPESFAVDQYRSYFTDKARGAVMRLSQDGLTPISDLGMRDYFKDAFRAKDIVLVGSYDDNKKSYNLTIKSKIQQGLSTVDEDDDGLTLLNDTGIPTTANYLGMWFRRGGVVSSDWTNYLVSGGKTGNPDTGFGSTSNPQMTVGSTSGSQGRGWAGIDASSSPSVPAGILHGHVDFSAVTSSNHLNPNLNNPITIWANKMTTGYSWRPTIDSTPNFDDLIAALVAQGPNNVYLYQNYAYLDTPIYNHLLAQTLGLTGQTLGVSFPINSISNYPFSWYGPTGVATAGSGFHQHPIESVYSVESISYDASLEVYELKVNWLVGETSFEDLNSFRWSLNGPFDISDDDRNLDIADAASPQAGLVNITASFSEDTKGWTSFKSWLQNCGLSINDQYFTFNGGNIFQHHANETRNNFYGIQYDSYVCVVFNDLPSSVKSFGALSYEGTQSRIYKNTSDAEYYNNAGADGWYASYVTTDLETGFVPEFIEKEGKWFNYIRGNKSNNLTNLDVSQFSTQGIGSPSAVSSNVSEEAPSQFKLTVKDTGDLD